MLKRSKFKKPKPSIVIQDDFSPGQEEPLQPSLEANEKTLQSLFSDSSDLVMRKWKIFGIKDCLIIFIDGLVDTNHVDDALLKSLMDDGSNPSVPSASPPQLVKNIEERLITVSQTKIVASFNEVSLHVLKGDAVLLIDKEKEGIALSMKKFDKRSISEPATETLVRGPRESFIENLRTNTSLIRRRVRSTSLKMESLSIGTLTKTDIVIAYIQRIAPDEVVQEVRDRLSRIEIDGILESNYIEEFTKDHKFSPFPTLQVTERPDTVVASLLEGRITILIDGTPMALIAPMTFWSAFLTAEDYYDGYLIATMIRWLRLIFLGVALLLPSLYVAITTFHQEMIPTSLALSVATSREGIPFPALVEGLIMEITFEALREAGVRLPRNVGQAISIVGALVIGQSAVQAGIVSAPMVIIVGMTGIASFIVPKINFSEAIRMLRFPMMIAAGTFGLYGIGAALIAILIHVINMQSFGVPYFTPIAPFNWNGLKDVFIRAPWWEMKKRPRFYSEREELRGMPSNLQEDPNSG